MIKAQVKIIPDPKRTELAFENLSVRMLIAAQDELEVGANLIRDRIIEMMSREKKTGRVYRWRGAKPGEKADFFLRAPQGHMFPAKKRNIPHRASAPDEAPAVDTGDLISKIVAVASKGETEVGALKGSIGDRALWLEDGTRFMAARPFLEPAADELMPLIEFNVKEAMLKSAIRAIP